MVEPLVSVICLCHNQGDFVSQAIQSVLDQDYKNVELIVVDDASDDNSREIITKFDQSKFKFIWLEENAGNCKAFNQGFQLSAGDFIIDLAADDVLLPNRISEGLKHFDRENVGVNFCDAILMNEKGDNLGTHYLRNSAGKLMMEIPTGDIYIELIRKYFISPPTMMIRREVLDELSGYDESLEYEDFDFWIRSSRNWKYSFTDQILVNKRVLNNSHTTKQFKFRTKHQRSTLDVCRKIKKLNSSNEENEALRYRCWYEVRQCIKQGNWQMIPSFLALLY